jgi:glycosidase
MIKNIIALGILFWIGNYNEPILAQSHVDKAEPPHWWVGMNNDSLEILFYGRDLFVEKISCDREDLIIENFKNSSGGDYLFINLLLKNTRSGMVNFKIQTQDSIIKWSYFLKDRDKSSKHPLGLSQSDFIYLLMPDRFSNGDSANDVIPSMNQHAISRDSLYERHGGDLQGVIDHLDYLKELGVSALWLNPVETNDEFNESYHGYAITDHYNIDPRFGSNELYKNLIEKAHKKDIKIIRDVVYNHFGDQHPLAKNPPDSSWINQWPTYTKSNFRASVMLDPHASEKDRATFSNGWFDHHMPDMNYKNKDLASYMIQNSIWWIEEYKLDAFRIDTYIYPDQDFMKLWGKRVKEEYPGIFLFAETWVNTSSIQAWFAGGNKLNQGETYIDGVTDFQLYFAIQSALNQKFSWTNGVSQIYYKLVDDVLYSHPENNVLFLDNHDLDRFYGVINQDIEKFKVGMGLLFTLRGIPSILYGTEILMPYKGSHGIIRTDFPGGWPNDPISKFTDENRTENENEAFNYIKQLAHWRSSSEAIKNGSLIQFIPTNGLYVYARISKSEVVLVLVNQSEKDISIDLDNYEEVLHGQRKAYDVIEQKSYFDKEELRIFPNKIRILSFKNDAKNSSTDSYKPSKRADK